MLRNYDVNTTYNSLVNPINDLANSFFKGMNVYVVAENKVPFGIVGYKVHGDDTHISLIVNDLRKDKEDEFMSYIVEDMTRKNHSKRIIIDNIAGVSEEALRYTSFKNINGRYVKDIDKYRLSLEDKVFDKEGYIIYQGKMKSVRFGLLPSNINGCGWISAYNLSKMLGKEIPMEECAKGLNKLDISGKLLGQEVFTLFRWLRKKGLPVKFSFLSKSNGIKHMKSSRFGILLYTHKRGSHYTAYKNVGGGKLHFYNAIYGKENHIVTPEEFFKKYVLLPIAMVIYVE